MAQPRSDRRLESIFQAEAQEHLQRMHACLGELEGGGDAQALRRPHELLFRATHSMKGASRAVGRVDIEQLCHVMENLLAGFQRGRRSWSAPIGDALHDALQALERLLDGSAAGAPASPALLLRLQALAEENEADGAPARAPPAPVEVTPPPAPLEVTPPPAPGGDAEAPDATVRVPVERLARLLSDFEGLVALRSGRQVLDEFDAALAASGAERERRLRSLRRAVGNEHRQLGGSVDGMLARMKSLLLMPVGSLGAFLQAAVRELARSEGKDVELRLAGGEVEMDRRILQELREPLVHLLRNAVHHGIEPPRVRAAAGKPARAHIEVAVQARPGGRAMIRVSDDGGGIDTVRLAQAARDAALPLPEGGEERLLPLVFERGLSTAPQVTRVAGRGVGLAIVREMAERLAGSAAVASQRGAGTTFTLLLPLSLATFRAVDVRAGGRAFLLPTAQVERCIRFRAADVRRVGGRDTLPLGEQRIAAARLAALLQLPAAHTSQSAHCLVLQAGGQRLAVLVDAVVGEQEVLSRSVDGRLAAAPLVAGMAVAGSGAAVPILNGAELVRAGLGTTDSVAPSAAAQARSAQAAILLAEDSITSRTLLKNILEVAGYRVEVAPDGREALERLRAGEFDALVSDIEMPDMDGIALTRAVRADARLAQLPVVLVTSLGSPADRERGAEAGANAYIVKSSFEQGNLLQALRELL